MASRVLENADNQITQKYKPLTHKAVDLRKYKNEVANIIAHTEGKVTMVQTGQPHYNKKPSGNASYGNFVKIKHPNGYYTLYAHLKSVKVKKNQEVKQGEVIGVMGNTGYTSSAVFEKGFHLHFEVRNKKDARINPTPYLDANLPDMGDTYRVYDNVKNKWLPKVKVGSSDYAGNFGHGVSALQITNRTYRVHDRVKGKWLPWITGATDYAGNLPDNIDGVQVKGATYRVHIRGGKWLEWVDKVDDTKNGYAGIIGETIDAIQIK